MVSLSDDRMHQQNDLFLMDFRHFAVRLVGGNNTYQGRVEVFVNGTWGTVCDDEWDMNDAGVVCRQLGYGRALTAPNAAAFGRGQGKIWMNNVRCTGNESTLTDCTHNEWDNQNCSHSKDAGVVCTQGKTNPLILFRGWGWGGYSSEFSVGVCRPVLQILNLFEGNL